MVTCPRCGTANPDGFRFCGSCATPLEARPDEHAERRKVVTVLFCDVAGSTRLGERLDPEALRAVMGRYFEALRSVLQRHGGTVEKFIGDAAMAVFGHPVLHEDDALRAVRAAADIHAAVEMLNTELEAEWGVQIATRIGVNTGQVVAGEPGSGETLVTGDAVNVASRLETAAPEGEILLGAPTYELVRDAVVASEVEPLALKGKELPVRAWRLKSVIADAAGHARRLDSPLVGRDRELRLLQEAFDQAVADQGAVLFTLLGSAGVGKSRLVQEFLARLGEGARVLRGRCLPYGEGITYWPLAEIVKSVAEITEGDAPETARRKLQALVEADERAATVAHHVAAAIGLAEETGGGEEIFWAARRLLEILAARQPLVVVFDDIHWAEPTFLDLIDHIADWSRGAPILMLCVARPELLEVRPTWGGGKLNATTLLLQPLPAGEVNQLVDNLLGHSPLSGAVVERVRDASEGNPLFVEEFIAMLIDDGVLRLEGDAWRATTDLEHIAVPPTIRSLLAARIDHLARAERSVIERASVVGKVFWRGAVAELAPEPLRPQVGPSLMGLVRKELVRPDRSDFAGDDAFRFRHLLLRDAAYEGLPKQERVQLHERFADWLERTAGSRVAEYDEVLAYHLDQAFRYRAELGPLDEAAGALARRAGMRFSVAGQRASERGDVAAAQKLLARALDLPGMDGHERLVPMVTLAAAEVESGRIAQAAAHYEAAIELAEKLNERRLVWRAILGRGQCRLLSAEEGIVDDLKATISLGLDELTRAGDDEGLAMIYQALAGVLHFTGDGAGVRGADERMLEHARRAGNAALELDALTGLAAQAVFDETDVKAGVALSEQALQKARAAGRRLSEAQSLSTQARLQALDGQFELGLRLADESIAILRDLGRRLHAAAGSQWLGTIHWLAGDYAAAEEPLTAGISELELLNERAYLSSSLGNLATSVAHLGRFDEAGVLAERARAAASSEDPDAQLWWRVGAARAFLGKGDMDEARRLTREASQLFGQGVSGFDVAAARVELADVVLALDGPSAAADMLRAARDHFARKNAQPMVDRLDARLGDLSAQASDGMATSKP